MAVASLAWWSAPRPTDADQARRDLEAGQVSSFLRADGWDDDRGLFLLERAPRVTDDGPFIVWTTTSGRVRCAAPDLQAGPEVLLRVSVSSSGPVRRPEADALAAEMLAANVSMDSATGGLGQVTAVSGWASVVLVLLFLLAVVFGPAPGRGTRMFWFWMGFVPFGLGMLAWLAVEHPWSRRVAMAQPGCSAAVGPAARRGGATGFLILLFSGLAARMLLVGLSALLGPWVVPW